MMMSCVSLTPEIDARPIGGFRRMGRLYDEAQKKATYAYMALRKVNGICVRCLNPVYRTVNKAYRRCKVHLEEDRKRRNRNTAPPPKMGGV